ncbi:nitroreductase [Melaminivora suipulveris]|uniref:Putative NAD(P)H nitroreductase n=1 Tax=Melaminivora suipulveris TaxID=2109913 RepID=A0A2R3QBH4_9BURK|nr:nitroreductase [Melaminivora suipulveris]AVO48997.1 nitroreductase [Melaminivora suipulveris]
MSDRQASAPCSDALAALLAQRQTVLPRRLGAPGPDAGQLRTILDAARHAPDHERLLPWRFILVPQDARAALGQAFAQALLERDAQAGTEEQQRARDKAQRAPVLLLAVVDEAACDAAVPPAERILSAGCAVQNLLLMATALGFGSALTSGQALQSRALRQLFALTQSERALCFINIGSVLSRKPPRERPALERYTSVLAPGRDALPLSQLFFPQNHEH